MIVLMIILLLDRRNLQGCEAILLMQTTVLDLSWPKAQDNPAGMDLNALAIKGVVFSLTLDVDFVSPIISHSEPLTS